MSLTGIGVISGADPIFLERGFRCIRVWELALLILSFHRIFNNGGGVLKLPTLQWLSNFN